MRNTIFLAAVAAAALLQVGIVEWANSHKGALEAQASTQTENVNPLSNDAERKEFAQRGV
jgi:hypothetical protein